MAYRVNGFSNQILAFPEPLFKVFHDTTLQGDGTPTSPLRAIGGGGGGSSTWGSISGTLSNQTDLQSALNSKFTLPSLTSGSVLFSDGSTIAQDNPNLFWDNTNNRLGIGTATPSKTLHVASSAGGRLRFGDLTSPNGSESTLNVGNSSNFGFIVYSNNNSPQIGSFSSLSISKFSTDVFQGPASSTLATFDFPTNELKLTPSNYTVTTGTSNSLSITSTVGAAAGSANYRAVNINYTINNSGAQTGNTTGIFLNATETALNGMSHNLMDLQYGGATKFSIRRDGYLYSVGGISNQSAYTGAGNSTASSPIYTLTGTWFTGGTTTTTKPHFLIEPTGATSTNWNTNGTAIGVNAATGFTGNFLDLQLNAANILSVSQTGGNTTKIDAGSSRLLLNTNTGVLQFNDGNSTLAWTSTGLDANTKRYSGGNLLLTKNQVLSEPNIYSSGTWITGGTGTTNKPYVLIEPSGATSTNWSTSGTGLGVNAPSGFVGNVADFQVNGTSILTVSSSSVVLSTGARLLTNSIRTSGILDLYQPVTISSTNNGAFHQNSFTLGGSSTFPLAMMSQFTVNQSGTAGYTGLLLDITETAVGSGTKNFFEARVNGVTKYSVSNVGTVTAANLVSNANIQAGSSGVIYWGANSQMRSAADGNIHLTNGAGTDFGRLQFGGTTSAFPSLKRSGTALHVRLADDSAVANIVAGVGTFAGTTINNSINANGNIEVASGANYFGWGTSSKLRASSGDGYIVATNFAGTDFSLFQFGGTTSSFPAIKKSGTTLAFRLADDSNYTGIDADNVYVHGVIRLGANDNRISDQGSGVIRITNGSANDIGRLQFGGGTSSYPAIKRSTTGLAVRLADDSADSFISASTFISTSTVRLKGYTVATLPASPIVGDVCYCTDLTSPTYMGTAVGGGSVTGKVFYNGTNWIT